jgi:hypothetical protein
MTQEFLLAVLPEEKKWLISREKTILKLQMLCNLLPNFRIF